MPITVPTPETEAARDRRRVEVLTITGEMFLRVLTCYQRPGHITHLPTGQLPDDARAVGFQHDPQENAIRLFIHSMSFDVSEDGAMPPEMPLNFAIITLPTLDRDGTPSQGAVSSFIANLRDAGLLLPEPTDRATH